MKKQKNIIPYEFSGWFTLFLSEDWMVEQEEDLLNVYSKVNPKGVLQFSFYKKSKNNQCKNDELALQHLNNFISQFNIIIDETV
ncbi:MAG: hypothetical protein Q8936_22530 [Bacillota bacterium]|nr:hypothetical protein [Bacillota bacterium]